MPVHLREQLMSRKASCVYLRHPQRVPVEMPVCGSRLVDLAWPWDSTLGRPLLDFQTLGSRSSESPSRCTVSRRRVQPEEARGELSSCLPRGSLSPEWWGRAWTG